MSNANNQPKLLSVAEACRLLAIGRTRLYQTLNEGRLDSLLIGRKRLITAASVERLVSEAQDSLRTTLAPPADGAT